MKEDKKHFNQDEVTRYHMEDEFSEIPHGRLVDIIPTIHGNSLRDQAILKKWEDHFQSMDIPYAITRKVVSRKGIPEFALWKEERI